jgi:hypothetical protein
MPQMYASGMANYGGPHVSRPDRVQMGRCWTVKENKLADYPPVC